MSDGERMSLREARRIAWSFRELVEDQCFYYYIAGSIARMRPSVGDVELVIIPHSPERLNARLDKLVHTELAHKWNYGTAHKPKYTWGELHRVINYLGRKVDVYLANPDNAGYIEWLRTGPGDANMFIMSQLKYRDAPFRFRDGHLWVGNTCMRLPTEEHLFPLLGVSYLYPWERTLERYMVNMARPDHRFGDVIGLVPCNKHIEARQSLSLFE